MTTEKGILNRTELLVGHEAMVRMGEAKVIVFGVGGVGSWCAEGLIRSGIRHLTIVDSDRVCVTNINRQSMATTRTVGRVKVDALRDKLLEVNPYAEIVALQEIFSVDTVEKFRLWEYDYVIDCIDSLKDKLELILLCTQKTPDAHSPHSTARFYSSMGAALKMDSTQIRVSEFWQVDGCPLAAMLRRRMRRQKRFPGRKFQCVWSPEVLLNLGEVFSDERLVMSDEPTAAHGNSSLITHHSSPSKGSLVHITAIYGFILAGLVIKDVVSKS